MVFLLQQPKRAKIALTHVRLGRKGEPDGDVMYFPMKAWTKQVNRRQRGKVRLSGRGFLSNAAPEAEGSGGIQEEGHLDT